MLAGAGGQRTAESLLLTEVVPGKEVIIIWSQTAKGSPWVCLSTKHDIVETKKANPWGCQPSALLLVLGGKK